MSWRQKYNSYFCYAFYYNKKKTSFNNNFIANIYSVPTFCQVREGSIEGKTLNSLFLWSLQFREETNINQIIKQISVITKNKSIKIVYAFAL